MTNWAAGARLPIVMANVNRSLGPGWNIWAEHTDAMQERDTGWLQVYVSTVQEAYDATLMAFRIAEHNDVLLPVMVNLDGFSLSHIMQPLDTVEPGDFIPPIHLPHAIDPNNPTRLRRAYRARPAFQIPLGYRTLDAGLGKSDRGRPRRSLQNALAGSTGSPKITGAKTLMWSSSPWARSARRLKSLSTSSGRRVSGPVRCACAGSGPSRTLTSKEKRSS